MSTGFEAPELGNNCVFEKSRTIYCRETHFVEKKTLEMAVRVKIQTNGSGALGKGGGGRSYLSFM